MNWLEIVSVHAAGPREKIRVIELCGRIRLPRLKGRSARLIVYGNSLSKEISIHIHWTSQHAPEGSSLLARTLSHTLSDFGLVSHSLWVEHNQSLLDKTV